MLLVFLAACLYNCERLCIRILVIYEIEEVEE
jgi:hypothetical protein